MKLTLIARWMVGKRMYDFFHQERTDGMQDIIKAKEKRDGHKGVASKGIKGFPTKV